MNSKLILILGAVLSSLVVFFCLKGQYTPKVDKPVKKVATIKPSDKNISQKDIIKPKLKLEEPKLTYRYEKTLTISSNSLDRTVFEDILQNYKKIQTDINFSKNIKSSPWAKVASYAIKSFQENNISDAKIDADASSIKIYGSFKDKKTYQNFGENIAKMLDNNISLENYVTLKEIVKKQEIIKKDIPKTKKITPAIKYASVQRDINTILKRYPVYFKFDSDVILNKGKRGLKKILKIINRQKSKVDLKVEGHTDGYGDRRYNEILSQKRADAVKRYLLKHSKNINSIIAKGYGSKKPKYKNPKDRRNRRVEIILLKGKE